MTHFSHCYQSDWPQNAVLFVGGPWHGQLKNLDDSPPTVLHVRVQNSCDRGHLSVKASLRPCLELEEIKALTGSSGHWEPCSLSDRFQQAQLSQHTYLLRSVLWRDHNGWADTRDVYIDDSVPRKDIESLIRSAQPR